MRNVKALTIELAAVFEQLKAGEIKHKDADSFANLAGKIINAHKVQIDYYTLRKETPKISFLEEDDA